MDTHHYCAYWDCRELARGSLEEVLRAAWPHREAPGLLFFNLTNGAQVDFDWRGTVDDAVARARGPASKTGPGRPRLGVVSTEVTLLPRHWEWLAAQPARASGTLRRLVEDAMAREASSPEKRTEALGRILWALAGNEPGFEEASRALYAGDRDTLRSLTRSWSGDLPRLVETWK